MKRIFLLFISCALLSFATGNSKSEYTNSRAAFSTFSIDFNLNGYNDLLIGHKTLWGDSNVTVSILNNDQQGYFSIDTTLTFCGYQENIFAIDANGDSFPDIITFYSDFSSGVADRYLRVLYNEQGKIVNAQDFTLNSSSTFSVINYGDINNDSFNDIIVASNNDQFWGVLYNDGTGNFSEPEYHYLYDYYPTDIDCGDLNGDNREDIVIAGADVEIYYSLESGFQQYQLSEQELRVKIVDFDNDGDNDIIGLSDLYMIGYFSISIYENLQGGNFLEHEEFLFQPSGSELVVEDFNNDSLPDILVALNNATGYYLVHNLGNNVLSEPEFIPVIDYGETSRQVEAADLDGNGYNDIVTVRYLYSPMSNNLSILFNDGNGNFHEDPITNIPTSNLPNGSQVSNLTCYPNPFKGNINIRFYVQEDSFTEISVYDLKGNLINTICSKNLNIGNHLLAWDGRDINGNDVQSGTYLIYLIINGNVSKTMKLIKY